MADSAFEAALRARLDEREGTAEDHWRGALGELGLSETRVNEILQQIGQRLTWALWNIAIEEAGALVRR